jgi:hypothetical protein
MANQVGPDIVSGTALPAGQQAGTEPDTDGLTKTEPEPGAINDPGHGHVSYHGRPSSWVAVSLITAGFLTGGLALIFGPHWGPTWPVFWVGAGLTVIGGLLALMTDIFEDWY